MQCQPDESRGRIGRRILHHDDVINEFRNTPNYGNDLWLDIVGGDDHCHPLALVPCRAPLI